MRTQPLNAMLTALSFNYSHKNENVWLYDMSNIYIPKELPLTELPDEREQLTLGAYGDGVDFFSMKGNYISQLLFQIIAVSHILTQ